ncbi:hypothetical protein [Actinomadura napierensis]|uniref:Uncharacterized protein n=1 Tax=Actinomadura napierensis TaxID=267854 RepID=A0ABN2YZN5_9ACTN
MQVNGTTPVLDKSPTAVATLPYALGQEAAMALYDSPLATGERDKGAVADAVAVMVERHGLGHFAALADDLNAADRRQLLAVEPAKVSYHRWPKAKRLDWARCWALCGHLSVPVPAEFFADVAAVWAWAGHDTVSILSSDGRGLVELAARLRADHGAADVEAAVRRGLELAATPFQNGPYLNLSHHGQAKVRLWNDTKRRMAPVHPALAAPRVS